MSTRSEFVAGEWGKPIALDAGIDISPSAGATQWAVTIQRPDGTFVASPATPSVGGVDLVIDGVTYAANTYALYTTQDGDFPAKGYYRIQLTVTFGTNGPRKSVTRSLEVLD